MIATGEPAIARILAHKLGREGHDVTVVASTQALDEVLGDGDIDVALVDLLLVGRCANASQPGGCRLAGDRRRPSAAACEPRDACGGCWTRAHAVQANRVAAQVATLLTLVAR